ncbi:hypothetical protein O181_005322 [Austropuccinia psidii MF-1]|uniref:Uncharacterized protein n=1 Tax=Austropuccinia psidii MF-1 TaxID=1389203 RepID=A0A9Q3BHW0_9BASI|nr:hypothetical protein [Austropuccinia psidii MF-1]
MPLQHSHPERQTRSQARTQAFLTANARAPLDSTPAVPQLRAQLDRGPYLEGAAPSRKEGEGQEYQVHCPGEEEEQNSVEEEESDSTEGVPSPFGMYQGTGVPPLAQSNQRGSHQSEPSLLAIMQQMTEIMANLKESSSSEA